MQVDATKPPWALFPEGPGHFLQPKTMGALGILAQLHADTHPGPPGGEADGCGLQAKPLQDDRWAACGGGTSLTANARCPQLGHLLPCLIQASSCQVGPGGPSHSQPWALAPFLLEEPGRCPVLVWSQRPGREARELGPGVQAPRCWGSSCPGTPPPDPSLLGR